MIEASSIAGWVAAEYLVESAQRRARAEFESNPSRHLVLRNFLRSAVAERTARFLTDEARFETRFGLYSARPRPVSPESWQNAERDDRFFRHGKLVGAHPGAELSPNLASFLKLRHDLYDADFRRLFESLTGLPLGGLGPLTARAYARGDFLRRHTDDASNRKLAFILYLAPRWEPAFGGALNVVDPTGDVATIAAEFNSVAILDVTAGSEHWVDEVTEAAGTTTRLTLSGWFAKPAEIARVSPPRHVTGTRQRAPSA